MFPSGSSAPNVCEQQEQRDHHRQSADQERSVLERGALIVQGHLMSARIERDPHDAGRKHLGDDRAAIHVHLPSWKGETLYKDRGSLCSLDDRGTMIRRPW